MKLREFKFMFFGRLVLASMCGVFKISVITVYRENNYGLFFIATMIFEQLNSHAHSQVIVCAYGTDNS